MNPVQDHLPNGTGEGVVVYRDSALENLWFKLQSVQSNVEYTANTLGEICDLLIKHVHAQLGETVFSHTAIPIYVLRGGLFFRSAFQRIKPYTPFGFVVPHMSPLDSRPTVIYGDLPVLATDGTYLLMDLIVNTGATIIASLRAVSSALNRATSKGRLMHIVTPFITAKATGAILGEFPSVSIHTFWNTMVIGQDGRLVGLRFDAGDYACGGGTRIRFTGVEPGLG